MDRNGGTRKQRLNQFVERASFSYMSFSPDLVGCAESQLRMALRQRSNKVFTSSDNHYTGHALGCIVLVIAAFEAWLNECVTRLRLEFTDSQVKQFMVRSLEERYRLFPTLVDLKELLVNDDLTRAIQVRDEIVHHLPRPLVNDVPGWLLPLQERGLFITAFNPNADFSLGQKLASYELAYWVCETISRAVTNLTKAAKPKTELHLTSNFVFHNRVCPPERLATYDQPEPKQGW